MFMRILANVYDDADFGEDVRRGRDQDEDSDGDANSGEDRAGLDDVVQDASDAYDAHSFVIAEEEAK